MAPPRTPRRQLVAATRPRRYPARPRINRVKRNREKPYYTDDPGGEGAETAREVAVCPDCARRNGEA